VAAADARRGGRAARSPARAGPLTHTPWAAFSQEYIDAHGISKTVEEVINATVKAKAPEPCSYMVRSAARGSHHRTGLCCT
jgi:hypothetical protein